MIFNVWCRTEDTNRILLNKASQEGICTDSPFRNVSEILEWIFAPSLAGHNDGVSTVAIWSTYPSLRRLVIGRWQDTRKKLSSALKWHWHKRSLWRKTIYLKSMHLFQFSSGIKLPFPQSLYVTMTVRSRYSWGQITASLPGVFVKIFLIPCPKNDTYTSGFLNFVDLVCNWIFADVGVLGDAMTVRLLHKLVLLNFEVRDHSEVMKSFDWEHYYRIKDIFNRIHNAPRSFRRRPPVATGVR